MSKGKYYSLLEARQEKDLKCYQIAIFHFLKM